MDKIHKSFCANSVNFFTKRFFKCHKLICGL